LSTTTARLGTNIHELSCDANFSRTKSLLKSDVSIAHHQGSQTSSTAEFITAVMAKYIIFTLSNFNRFKHPKSLILNRYNETGASVYRSDYDGALNIDFLSDKPIKINAWRRARPLYWQDQYTSNL
jgi:competence protein ComEC